VDLGAALLARLSAEQRRALDRLAPAGLVLPSGRSVPIDYGRDPPVAAVRVQELFGMDRHPSILEGRVPLVLELLSPAGRPIQRTRDLPGFWRGSWGEVRRVMRGRYPKHPWPEDPLSAAPPRPGRSATGTGGRSGSVR